MAKALAQSKAPAASQPRGDAVVQKLVTGGMKVFLERGYEGTSVDAVAAETKTSKATIYRYFPDKETLFRAMVRHAVQNNRAPIDFPLKPSNSIRSALAEFAERIIDRATAPSQLELCRVFVFEIRRFPEIEALFAETDEIDFRWLIATFEHLGRSNTLKIRNAEHAADAFMALLVTPFVLEELFRPRATRSTADRRLYIKRATDQFLTLYPPASAKHQ